MQNIAEGDLTTQIEVEGDDEFSLMAANLNRMGEEIRVLMEKERARQGKASDRDEAVVTYGNSRKSKL